MLIWGQILEISATSQVQSSAQVPGCPEGWACIGAIAILKRSEVTADAKLGFTGSDP